MEPENRYTEEKIVWIKQHSPKLMSFAITRPKSYTYKAGQFARLGFIQDGEYVWRAYSMVSPEYQTDCMEFYAILIADGVMSNFFLNMQVGDKILLWEDANGFLYPELFNETGKDLVLCSTGSGLAPFMPMLFKPELYTQFNSVSLVHSVSYAKELVYDQRIAEIATDARLKEDAHKFKYQRIVTREPFAGALNKRVNEHLANGELEQALNLNFTKEQTRFMLCGNPTMVKAVFGILKERGFTIHRSKVAGEIIMEHAF